MQRTFLRSGRTGHRLGDTYETLAQDLSEKHVQQSLEKLRSALERVERALEGQEYLLGEFSIADIVLLPTVVRMEDLSLADMWNDLPDLSGWFKRMQNRPSFATAYYKGTRLVPGEFSRPED